MTEEIANPQAASSDGKPPQKVKRGRKPQTVSAASEAPGKAASRAGRKGARYSHAQSTELLQSIENMLRAGTHKLSDAIKKVGIGEQTYYNWRKTSAAAETTQPDLSSPSDDLQDLLKLEEENQRLRKSLADKLRSENAELRKRLGMK